MTSPSISVVMSVYNGEAYLAEAVESILKQTFGHFEFIIIDDGSSDNTSQILADYASLDSRIRLITHENKGRATSLNIGIEAARSDLIARMDADDIALPDRLQQQFEFITSHPEVGVLGGAVELVDRKGRVIRQIQPPVSDTEIRAAMLQGNPMWHPTITMRKHPILVIGGYRKQFLDADDYDLWLRMIERTQIANLDTRVLRYRIHANQVSVQNMRHQAMCVFSARSAAARRREGAPDPLSGVAEVTPALTNSLGIKPEDIDRTLADACIYWLDLLKDTDDVAALGMVGELFRLPQATKRPLLCEACLSAARIHYGKGRRGRALLCAARAISLRPAVAGRPVKRALQRLANAIAH